MKVKISTKAIVIFVSFVFLEHASLAMNYYPQHSIPSTEAKRISELSKNMNLDEVYKNIVDDSKILKKTIKKQDILQILTKRLKKVEKFCHTIEEKDHEQNESDIVLLQLQMTKLLVLKTAFDFYMEAKKKLGTDANSIIQNSEISSTLLRLFGNI